MEVVHGLPLENWNDNQQICCEDPTWQWHQTQTQSTTTKDREKGAMLMINTDQQITYIDIYSRKSCFVATDMNYFILQEFNCD